MEEVFQKELADVYNKTGLKTEDLLPTQRASIESAVRSLIKLQSLTGTVAALHAAGLITDEQVDSFVKSLEKEVE